MSNSLIQRLSEAAGPDRELDGAIAKAMKLCDPTCTYDKEKDALFWCEYHDQHIAEPCWQELARYTAALDAALTLVPEGMKYAVGTWSGNFANCGWDRAQASPADFQCEPAPSPAIALCIAALRARGLDR